jgi:hypothetical protein
MFDALLTKLETDLRTAFDGALAGLVVTARTQLDSALAEITGERAKGIAEVAREKVDLHCEIATMHKHKEAHEGSVVLNVGGFRYETSVQTLRRSPHTFFDAYFSGRYAQDVCADGSIFIDRDGEHFGHVLLYLRDGVVSVAEQEVSELDVSVVRGLKREYGFYCIGLCAEVEVTVMAGGSDANHQILNSVEHFDVASGLWREVASMGTARKYFALCGIGDGYYAIGGVGSSNLLASVLRYDLRLGSWSTAPPLPKARAAHCAVVVDDAMCVLGGIERVEDAVQVIVQVSKSVLKFDNRV